MKALLIIATALFLSGFAHAELVWDHQQLEFHPSLSATEVKAEFRFVNRGKDPVTIEAIAPSCGCTTAVTDKMTYRPGEKGTIEATLHVGELTGLQNKSINLRIKGEAQPILLTMITHLPDLMTISPRMVSWPVGGHQEPLTITLTVQPDVKLRVNRVLSTDPGISAELQSVSEGKLYRVVVTPRQGTGPLIAVLSIDATVKPGIQKIFTAYAQVKATETPTSPAKP